MGADLRYTVNIEVDRTTDAWAARAIVNTYADGLWISKRHVSLLASDANLSQSFDQWVHEALAIMAERVADCIGTSTLDGDGKPYGDTVEADDAHRAG